MYTIVTMHLFRAVVEIVLDIARKPSTCRHHQALVKDVPTAPAEAFRSEETATLVVRE